MRTYLFIFSFFCLSSCCKFQYETEPRIWVSYNSSDFLSGALQIRTVKGDVSQIIDTIHLKPIQYSSVHDPINKPRITVEPLFVGDYDYMILPSNKSRIDTISSVSHTRGKCNMMKEVAYLLNGTYSNNNHQEIILP